MSVNATERNRVLTERTPAFGKIRQLIWPIHNFELKRLIPMLLLSFLIAFVFNVLHCLKTPLMVKAAGSGAEVIPFLQLGAVLPAALFLTYIYTLLISKFPREKVFYIIISCFTIYFALFLLILYPNNDSLQMNALADFLQANIFTGPGAKGFIATIRHLNLSLLYVASEMWAVIVLFILFWGFANEVTHIEEAKRFYAIFALGGNFSGIVSGEFARSLEKITFIPVPSLYKGNEWLFLQMSSILIACGLILYLFWWLNRYAFKREYKVSHATTNVKIKQPKISLKESLIYLSKSRYLTYLVLIVSGYYIVYSLADIMWTHQVGLALGSSKDVNAYMSRVISLTGVVSVVLSLLVSGNVIRRFGWTIAALITPIVWLLTSIGFFSSIIFDGTTAFAVLSHLVTNPVNIALLFGSLQITLGRSCKYTLFDETKEIAFIPLSKEEQRKGKVVVDGLASRFGKSGGSIIYILLFYFLGEMVNVIPYIAVIIFIALAAWLYSIVKMGRIIDAVTSKEQQLAIEEEPELIDNNTVPDAST